jgi:hypothetical protein
MTDPIVAEVRAHRQAHTEECGGDLEAICADLRRKQAASGQRVVRLPPRRIEADEGSPVAAGPD